MDKNKIGVRVEKKWVRPKLVVLARAKPERGVLEVCKTGQSGSSGALYSSYAQCSYYLASWCAVYCDSSVTS